MSFLPNLVGLYTIVRREWVRTFRIWGITLLPPIITTTLYFMIFGHIIGRRVGVMEGHPYLDFIAPGLIAMSIIGNAYASTVSAFFSLKFHRDIDEILITPMPSWVMLFSLMISGMIRGVLVGICVLVVALFFTRIHLYSVSIMILVALLSAAIFALGGILNGIYAKSFDDLSIIPTFVLTPLTYLGGVFYSLSLLPAIWRHLSLANPIVYIIGAFRFGVLGIHQGNLVFELLIMLVIASLLFLFAWWLLVRGIGVKN